MGNSTYQQFLLSKEKGLVYLDGIVSFGSSGTPTLQSGSPNWYSKGIFGVTHLTTGIYQIKLVENFNAFVDFQSCMLDGVTGSEVAITALSASLEYQITTLGNSNWYTVGVDNDYVPQVGTPFVATGVGTGTGKAKLILESGVAAVSVCQSQQALLQNKNAALGKGSSIIVNMYDYGGSAVDPAVGSQMQFEIWLKNSSANP